jgi:hypothetical protein
MSSVRVGDRFVATADIAISGLSHWKAPFTGDFETVIPEGTVLVAPHDAFAEAEGFYCVPEQCDDLEAVLVPEADRLDPKYDGYSFVFLESDIGGKLRRLNAT